MKFTFAVFFIFLIVFSCHPIKSSKDVLQVIGNQIAEGNFKKANQLAESLKLEFPHDSLLIFRLDSMEDMTHRISLDFPLPESGINEQLHKVMGDFTPAEKEAWGKNNLLEYRIINGEKRYFNRAASNLKLLLNFRQKKANPATGFMPDKTDSFRIKHAQKVADQSKGQGIPVQPVNIKIKYKLTVKPDAVPSGEIIRCWMPYPQENHARQQNVTLIRTSPDDHFIAPDKTGQRSLYMEQLAVNHQPAIFEMELSYRAYAQYFDLSTLAIKPYQTGSPLYLKYTSEEKPHIVFTEKIRKLSDTIVGKETRPEEIVRKIFYWIDENIPWAGALEYSIMPNIPEYVIDNRHGDCGMQTLLFMTLARYNGIPVKWQSGWNMSPGGVNLHDWCEVYYEGIGWVPLDMSFGRLPSACQKIRDYYMSGLDAYRLIVNDATGTPFNPVKRFIRSEPVDFQRGEVEWRGGNLYFDKWNYNMDVEYF